GRVSADGGELRRVLRRDDLGGGAGGAEPPDAGPAGGKHRRSRGNHAGQDAAPAGRYHRPRRAVPERRVGGRADPALTAGEGAVADRPQAAGGVSETGDGCACSRRGRQRGPGGPVEPFYRVTA